jgi:hypothetical protein
MLRKISYKFAIILAISISGIHTTVMAQDYDVSVYETPRPVKITVYDLQGKVTDQATVECGVWPDQLEAFKIVKAIGRRLNMVRPCRGQLTLNIKGQTKQIFFRQQDYRDGRFGLSISGKGIIDRETTYRSWSGYVPEVPLLHNKSAGKTAPMGTVHKLFGPPVDVPVTKENPKGWAVPPIAKISAELVR